MFSTHFFPRVKLFSAEDSSSFHALLANYEGSYTDIHWCYIFDDLPAHWNPWRASSDGHSGPIKKSKWLCVLIMILWKWYYDTSGVPCVFQASGNHQSYPKHTEECKVTCFFYGTECPWEEARHGFQWALDSSQEGRRNGVTTIIKKLLKYDDRTKILFVIWAWPSYSFVLF